MREVRLDSATDASRLFSVFPRVLDRVGVNTSLSVDEAFLVIDAVMVGGRDPLKLRDPSQQSVMAVDPCFTESKMS